MKGTGMLALTIVVLAAWLAVGLAMQRAAWQECRTTHSRLFCWNALR